MHARRISLIACGCALSLCLCATAAIAATDSATDEAFRSNENFVLGNLEFVLLHEMAHRIIEDFDVPVLGPQEPAADYLAAVALLRVDRFNVERSDRARAFLVSTAEAFEMSWEAGQRTRAEIPYWSAHALGIQRFYQITCLIYGADPERFRRLPTRTGLPEIRKQGCPAEFARASRAMEWLLAEYGRSATDSVEPRVSVLYEPSPSRANQRIVDVVRASGVVENTARRIDESFALPEPAQIVLRRCGRAEAGWRAGTRQLVVCYELLDLLMSMAKRRG
jgi:hypothetical protein